MQALKFYYFFIFSCLYSTIIADNPLLVAVLMVKNESEVMEATLQPLVEGGIRHFLIFDTGSTDDTITISRQFFVDHNIANGVVIEGSWIDFAASRNEALDWSHHYFPDAVFMLMLDAEWKLRNGQDLLTFCQEHQHETTSLYLVRLLGFNCDFLVPRLIRCHHHVHFEGKVHEVPNIVSYECCPKEIYFEFAPTRNGCEKTYARWKRDVKILLQEIAERPRDSRTAFYLAQTYACLGDLDNAARWYEYRASLVGWDEENFMTLYKLAQVYEWQGNMDQAVYTYLKAYGMRPQRAEPLIRLAEYYWSTGQYALCYLFAKQAVDMPYPASDRLPIDSWLYDFTRYDLLSIAASYIGEYEIGEQALLIALQVAPDMPHLHHNLALYLQRRNALTATGTV